MKFRDMYSRWRQDKMPFVKESTMAIYAFRVENYLLPTFGDSTDISESDVQNFMLEKHGGGLSRHSIRDIIEVLKMIVDYGARHGWAEKCDWSLRLPPARSSGKPPVLTVSQEQRLMSHLTENLSTRNLAIIICLDTGMRIGEACGLKWEDFNTEDGFVSVRRTVNRIYHKETRHSEIMVSTPKTTNSVRDIPLNSWLQRTISALIPLMKGSNYVASNSSQPMEPRMLRAHFNKLLKSLDIQHFKFHTLRHTFATRCIEGHCDYKTISTILGHADVTTTLNLYVHPNMEEKRKCVNTVLDMIHRFE